MSISAGVVLFGALRFALLLHFEYPFIVGLLHFQGEDTRLILLFLNSTVLLGHGKERFVRAAIGAYKVVMNSMTGGIFALVGGVIGMVHDCTS